MIKLELTKFDIYKLTFDY